MTTTQERPGWGPEAAHKSFGGDTPSLRDNGPVRLAPAVEDYLSRYAVRMVEDAVAVNVAAWLGQAATRALDTR